MLRVTRGSYDATRATLDERRAEAKQAT
jgi:hypothetical protein